MQIKIVNVFNGLYLWTCCVLLFSCFVFKYDFTGSFSIYLLGSPFVAIVIKNIKDPRKE